uniref:Uncharacterized protein n=1 Tax=Glossina austeni TaxID=7395 RepID=A0A1A9VHB3_GLOAU
MKSSYKPDRRVLNNFYFLYGPERSSLLDASRKLDLTDKRTLHRNRGLDYQSKKNSYKNKKNDGLRVFSKKYKKPENIGRVLPSEANNNENCLPNTYEYTNICISYILGVPLPISFTIFECIYAYASVHLSAKQIKFPHEQFSNFTACFKPGRALFFKEVRVEILQRFAKIQFNSKARTVKRQPIINSRNLLVFCLTSFFSVANLRGVEKGEHVNGEMESCSVTVVQYVRQSAMRKMTRSYISIQFRTFSLMLTSSKKRNKAGGSDVESSPARKPQMLVSPSNAYTYNILLFLINVHICIQYSHTGIYSSNMEKGERKHLELKKFLGIFSLLLSISENVGVCAYVYVDDGNLLFLSNRDLQQYGVIELIGYLKGS